MGNVDMSKYVGVGVNLDRVMAAPMVLRILHANPLRPFTTYF